MHLRVPNVVAETGKKIHWDWTINLGNVLSMLTMTVVGASVIFGWILTYRERFNTVQSQISGQNAQLVNQGTELTRHAKKMEEFASTMVQLRLDAQQMETRRLNETISVSAYLRDQTAASGDRARIEKSVSDSLAEIKNLLRDQAKREEDRFLSNSARMDSLRDRIRAIEPAK